MQSINTNNINKLNINNHEAVNDSNLWLNIKIIEGEQEVADQYSAICHQFQEKNKWVLIVNPENNSLDNLQNKAKEGFSRVLKVHSNNKVEVKIENIETALRKGNCSAVVLNNTSFNNDELTKLYTSAKQGNTQCVILNNTASLH